MHLIQVSAIVGAILPVLFSIVNQSHWSSAVKSVTVAALCVPSALVTAAVEGQLSLDSWATSLIFIYGAVITTYKGLYKPTGVAPTIEKATTIGSTP
jgi:hypothetical protein